MRSMRLLAVAVLAVVLALSSAQNAFAVTELAYDNGSNGGGVLHDYAGVLFQLPSGVSSARVKYVRFAWNPGSLPFDIHVTGPDHVTELGSSPLVLSGLGSLQAGTGCPAGWGICYGYDLTSLGIVVTGGFFVILHQSGGSPQHDNAGGSGHSYKSDTDLAGLVGTGNDWLIRVDIDPIVPITSVGLVTTVAVVVVKPWKKTHN
jgi:hypothetical protein